MTSEPTPPSPLLAPHLAPLHRCCYHVTYVWSRALATLGLSLRIAGRDNVPRTGPVPAPLFWPSAGGIAVVVGRPLDPARYLALPREQALTELFHQIEDVQRRAEKLRRRA